VEASIRISKIKYAAGPKYERDLGVSLQNTQKAGKMAYRYFLQPIVFRFI